MRRRGVCHGFRIESDIEFETLRDGDGDRLTVGESTVDEGGGELVAEWRPRPENPFHGRLLADGSRFSFWASDAGWYSIDAASRVIDVPASSQGLRRELRMLGIPAALCMAHAGDLSIHAAAVDIGGRALLLAGPAHHGKTTLSAAFARAGYRLLSEDTTRCHAGASPFVFPGPAVLRLRPDVARRLEIPTAQPAEPEPAADRLHLLLDPSVRGSGESLPLAAIVLLKISDGEVRLRSVRAVQAVRDLWALTFQLPTDESRTFCFDRLTELATNTSVVEVERPLTVESLGAVVQLLAEVAD